MMDSRNSDDSEEVIQSILSEGKKEYIIEKHKFIGFGQARTKSLDAAWRHFAKATHVIIADPDWRPRVDSLNISQLIAANAEVFRFTIYDRNQITTRRIDWMLRHRQGLSMRYHLHEVLDIGFYSWTDTTWEVDEIEQEGTWHNDVGHENSFAAERYKFDLEMLEKDKQMYSNDPHVDYYLGITHNSYAEKLLNLELAAVNDQAIQTHFDKAVHYLKTRATAEYEEEFSEQRWGSMLTLATMYDQPRWRGYDRQEAIKWYKLCRDFSPRQFECAAQLISLYLSSGLSSNAIEDAWSLARTEPEPRTMLNTRGGFECSLPDVLVSVFSSHLTFLVSRGQGSPVKGLSKYSKYVLALANQVLGSGACSASQKARLHNVLGARNNLNAIHQSLAADEVADSVHFLDDNSLLVDLAALCKDRALREYLVDNQLHVHPCGEIQPPTQCADFSIFFPGVAEDKQMVAFGEYVGAASLIDVIHHVHLGNGFRVTPAGRRFRILFAEHFNPRMLYKLIAFAETYMNGQLEVVVVHPDESLLRSMVTTISGCGHLQNVEVDFMQAASLIEWVRNQADTLWHDLDEGRSPEKGFFDYIEYNGGLSRSLDHTGEMSQFKDILHPDGVIGATYYTSNAIQASLFDLVRTRNTTANLAFSGEASRLVEAYLQSRGLSAHAQDTALVEFFSGTGSSPQQSNRVYTVADVEQLIISQGYQESATLPTSTSHPFSEVSEFYDVAKFKEYGASEDSFLYYFGSAMRHTVYLTPCKGQDVPLGRATPHRVMERAGEDFQIVDRTGSMGTVFREEMVQSALNMDYPIVYGTANAPPLPFNLSFTIPRSILPALPLLQNYPKMRDLIDVCERYWNSSVQTSLYPNFDLNQARTRIIEDMMRFLGFMERINVLSFVHNGDVAWKLRGHRAGDIRPSLAIPSEVDASASKIATDTLSSPSTLVRKGLEEVLASASSVEALAAVVEKNVVSAQHISEVLTRSIDQESSSLSLDGTEPTSVNMDRTQESYSANIIPKRQDIIRPRQTLPALHASHRRAECSTQDKWRNLDCRVDVRAESIGLPVRITSKTNIVCRRKMQFDRMQMLYIAKRKPQLEEFIRTDGLPGVEKATQLVDDAIQSYGSNDPSACLMLSDESMEMTLGAFNRIFFVSREPMLIESVALLQNPAPEKLSKAISTLKSAQDAPVIDNLLTETALAALSSVLLLSTIYFDLTNGEAFVSHIDDGLAFRAFERLGREISQALPGTVVKNTFAVAMDLRQDGVSPMMMAEQGEVALVLWLTPNSLGLNAAKTREGETSTDGIMYFGPLAYDALRESHVDFHPDVHTEFLTAAAGAPFDYAYPDATFEPKSVKRNVNRAVLMNSRQPFSLVTRHVEERGSLDQDAVHAVVIILGTDV